MKKKPIIPCEHGYQEDDVHEIVINEIKYCGTDAKYALPEYMMDARLYEYIHNVSN